MSKVRYVTAEIEVSYEDGEDWREALTRIAPTATVNAVTVEYDTEHPMFDAELFGKSKQEKKRL